MFFDKQENFILSTTLLLNLRSIRKGREGGIIMYLSYAKDRYIMPRNPDRLKGGIGDYGQISVNNTGADDLWFSRASLETTELRRRESH